MNTCRWMKKIESHFDGRTSNSDVQAHLAECPRCREYLETLRSLRSMAEKTPRVEVISDIQLPYFLEGIRQGVTSPVRIRPWRWAFLSGTCAALVVALAIYALVTGGPAKVEADTVVESVSTELEEATVEYHKTNDGTAVIWVHMPQGDMP